MKAYIDFDIAPVVKKLRRHHSQEAVARLLGLGQSTVSGIESERRPLRDVVKIREAFTLLSAPDRAALEKHLTAHARPATFRDPVVPYQGHLHPGDVLDRTLELVPPKESGEVIDALIHADLENSPILSVPVAAGSVTPTVLSWLVNDAGHQRAQTEGNSAADAVRAAAAGYAALDNRYGGIHARLAAVHYLRYEALPLLARPRPSAEHRALLSAIAELVLSIGWMSYDVQRNGAARRYFIQALNLADHAGDRNLGASVLSAMSHQANYLREHAGARDLARAALSAAHTATPGLRAQFLTMEARAHAGAGDSSACTAALVQAEAAFARQSPGEDPAWIGYFNEAEFADEIAHCHRDLGQADAARSYAEQCLAAVQGEEYARSRVFSRLVLVSAVLSQGNVDEACALGMETVPIVRQTSSARCLGYLRDLLGELEDHHSHPEARQFISEASSLLQPAQ